MIGKVSRLLALSWPERGLLLQAAFLLPLTWAGLRLFGLPRLHGWATRPAAGAARMDPTPQAIGVLVAVAGNRLPFPSTCLTRSLLLLWLLRRRGLRAELRIGVRRVEAEIESHAWVELDGEPVNETQEVAGRFAVFDAPLPSGSGAFS
jgi:hypothetical protein